MPSTEFCNNTVCSRDQSCSLIRSLTIIKDSPESLTQPQAQEIIEIKRVAKVIFNCPNPISDLFVAVRAKAKP
jgi:hypothetical protein